MDIYEKLLQIVGEKYVLKDESMSLHTSFKTGGNADYFVIPQNEEQLLKLINLDTDLPIIFFGNGSNTLVTDKGIRGIVVSLKGLNNVKFDGENIEVESGFSISKLSNLALENGLTGLEYACGIPGTIGGAIFMNAGAYGMETKDIIRSVKFYDFNDKKLKEYSNEMCNFSYRKSIFQEMGRIIILSCKIKLSFGNKEEIKSKMDENMASRNAKQPINLPSAGSTFRREEGIIVAKLIDESGLKGYKIGGAEVSKLHAGFIVNSDNATSKDILDLISYIKKVVKEKYDVELHEEIRIVGER